MSIATALRRCCASNSPAGWRSCSSTTRAPTARRRSRAPAPPSWGARERLTVLRWDGPADGWTGKLAAMDRGFDHVVSCQDLSPISCCSATPTSPSSRLPLERLVAGAAARGTVLCLADGQAALREPGRALVRPGLRLLLPDALPFRARERSRSKVAGAAGGVMLVRPAALAEAGGLPHPRRADRRLRARRAVEEAGADLARPHRRLRLQPAALSAFSRHERMVTRSAYAQLALFALAARGRGGRDGRRLSGAAASSPFRERRSAPVALVAYLLMAQCLYADACAFTAVGSAPSPCPRSRPAIRGLPFVGLRHGAGSAAPGKAAIRRP